MDELAAELARLYPDPDHIRVVLSRTPLAMERVAHDPVPSYYWMNVLSFAVEHQALDTITGAVLRDHEPTSTAGSRIIQLTNAIKQAGESARINKRRVLVMMSFGGNEGDQQRHATLDFLRIKELLERTVRVLSARGNPIMYEVSRLDDYYGNYVQRAIPQIAEADVIIGFVNRWTTNLTFEIALRWLVREELLLVIHEDQIDQIPIYLKSTSYIKYDAATKAPARDSKNYGKAKQALDKPERTELEVADAKLVEDLEKALGALEHGKSRRSAEIANLLPKYVSPSLFLSAWSTFYPLSIVRADWRGMTGGAYGPGDLIASPVVCWGNEQFLHFFAIQRIKEPGLGGAELLERLKSLSFITPRLHELVVADQGRVSQAVFFQNRNEPATVPLIIQSHTRPEFRGRSFLPMIVGRNTVGDLDGRHCTYLLVAYVDLPTLTLEALTPIREEQRAI